MVSIYLQERTQCVKLRARIKLFKALVQEFQKHQNSVCINKQLGQIDKLVDAISLEVLQQVNEKVRNNHRCDDSVSVVFVSILFQLKVVAVVSEI